MIIVTRERKRETRDKQESVTAGNKLNQVYGVLSKYEIKLDPGKSLNALNEPFEEEDQGYSIIILCPKEEEEINFQWLMVDGREEDQSNSVSYSIFFLMSRKFTGK